MEQRRLKLHDILCEVLGSKQVYFSPPSCLKYPCIKYQRAKPSVGHADNIEYRSSNCWMLTIIDEDPDSEIPDKLKEKFKKYFTFDRQYAADGLNHFVYTLYF